MADELDQLVTGAVQASKDNNTPVADYLRIIELKNVINDQLKALTDSILDDNLLRPLMAGGGATAVVTEKGKRYAISTMLGERYVWDKKVLAEIAGAEPTGNRLIEVNLTVNREKYDRASTEEQEQLRPALTIEKGRLKLEIEEL